MNSILVQDQIAGALHCFACIIPVLPGRVGQQWRSSSRTSQGPSPQVAKCLGNLPTPLHKRPSALPKCPHKFRCIAPSPPQLKLGIPPKLAVSSHLVSTLSRFQDVFKLRSVSVAPSKHLSARLQSAESWYALAFPLSFLCPVLCLDFAFEIRNGESCPNEPFLDQVG